MMNDNAIYAISELAKLELRRGPSGIMKKLDYFSQTAVKGGQRIFSKKELVRLRLISRGKKYGFSLTEIREMIQLFDHDPSGMSQLKKTMDYGRGKIEEVTTQINDLKLLRSEMEELLDEFQKKLSEMEREKK